MIAEQLIRSGQAFVQGISSPTLLLQMVSDSNKIADFWERVIIVELERETQQIVTQPIQRWGNWEKPTGSKRERLLLDKRSSLVPIFHPSGGNSTVPQGFYALPVYPIREKNWLSFTTPKAIEDFLRARLKRTIDFQLEDLIIKRISQQVYDVTAPYTSDRSDSTILSVLIIAEIEGNGIFESFTHRDELSWLSASRLFPGHHIHANVELMLERIWKAKAKEGAEKGQLKEGICAFTGQRGSVISGDNKAWPWFTTTWEAPFPNIFGDSDHVHRMAFSPEAYQHLTVGATLFGKLTKQLDYNLNKQLFAPVDSVGGRDNAARGKAKATVYGSAIVTPLLDNANLSEEDSKQFAFGLQNRITETEGSRGAKLLLSNLLGYEDDLPSSLLKDDFRLLYFTFRATHLEQTFIYKLSLKILFPQC